MFCSQRLTEKEYFSRCLLKSRFELYENGFENDVDSSCCSIFATERMNALKGQIAIMMLLYYDNPGNPLNDMLDNVRDRNFVQVRMDPNLDSSYETAKMLKTLEEDSYTPLRIHIL